jgi:hypothetical protein
MSSGLRQRNVQKVEEEPENENFYEKIKKLDAFTKIAEEAEAPKTTQGGICGFLTLVVMVGLFLGEMNLWFFHTKIKVSKLLQEYCTFKINFR